MPVAWLIGAPRSSGRRSGGMSIAMWVRTSAPSERCDWMTPFGLALVPEVYATTAGLAGSTVTDVSSRSPSRRSPKRVASAGRRSPTSTTCSSASSPGRTASKFGEVVDGAETIGDHEDAGA